jgi:hypothetical protein
VPWHASKKDEFQALVSARSADDILKTWHDLIAEEIVSDDEDEEFGYTNAEQSRHRWSRVGCATSGRGFMGGCQFAVSCR